MGWDGGSIGFVVVVVDRNDHYPHLCARVWFFFVLFPSGFLGAVAVE